MNGVIRVYVFFRMLLTFITRDSIWSKKERARLTWLDLLSLVTLNCFCKEDHSLRRDHHFPLRNLTILNWSLTFKVKIAPNYIHRHIRISISMSIRIRKHRHSWMHHEVKEVSSTLSATLLFQILNSSTTFHSLICVNHAFGGRNNRSRLIFKLEVLNRSWLSNNENDIKLRLLKRASERAIQPNQTKPNWTKPN